MNPKALPLDLRLLHLLNQSYGTFIIKEDGELRCTIGSIVKNDQDTIKILWSLHNQGYLKRSRNILPPDLGYEHKSCTKYTITDKGQKLLREFGL